MVVLAVDGTPVGERTIPVVGLLLSVVLLLLLPDLINYIRSRKNKE